MIEFINEYGALLLQGTLDTIYMSFVSTIFAYILGLPLGILLYVTKKDGICENVKFNKTLSWIINILRSIPFLILMISIKPLTKLVVGKIIGSTAAIVPLTIGMSPFIARMVETALSEIDTGVIEACQCMGASNKQIITKVLISESLPSIIRGFSITTITLIGYSAIAGALGAGGLGDIAIRYGHHRTILSVMYSALAILIFMVCIVQTVFDRLANKTDKRNII